MAANAIIFSFRDNFNEITVVYRNTVHYDTITYKTFLDSTTVLPVYEPGDQVGSPVCYGTTKVTYFFKTDPVYAYFELEYFSGFCGYVPVKCDMVISGLTTTNETATGANDGTLTVFATSSYGVSYYILAGQMSKTQSTGYFTGLEPGNYTITARDEGTCQAVKSFTIVAYLAPQTHYKYRLQFNSILTNITWECRFLDIKHNYDASIYPIDLDGTHQPMMYKTDNPNEDKTEPMLLTTVTINVWNNGTFEVDEFALSDERTWKVELYRNGELYFQGWLLPDQIQDLYADPNYPVTFIVTDGIASLKGNDFADQTLYTVDSYGNIIYQQLYGVQAWSYLVRCCLKQLAYDYLYITIISSLQNSGTYDSQIWTDIGTWGDILYDSSGIAVDAYTALALLLRAFNFFITQVNGTFVIGTWNDLAYINNNILASVYTQSIFAFDSNFNQLYAKDYAVTPLFQNIGKRTFNPPINPPQSINYDNAYQIEEEDVSFNNLALLYENPSFEIGAVQGNLPLGVSKNGTINAYLNYEPYDPNNHTTGAYDGSWVVRFTGALNFGSGIEYHDYLYLSSNIHVDQPNKKVKLSFVYRPLEVTGYTGVLNPVFSFAITFEVTSSGNVYLWTNIAPPDGNTSKWQLISSAPAAGQTTGQKITEYGAWNTYSEVTLQFPEDGIGNLNFRMYAGDYFGYTSDSSKYPPNGTPLTVDIDFLQMTLDDSANPINYQSGEKHIITNQTQYTKSEKKSVISSLFTFPDNKRVAGNVFDFHDYAIGNVANTWRSLFHTENSPDRLPSVVLQGISRNYQYPMHIFEGDIKSDSIQFLGIFTLVGYNGVLFMPFSIEADLRNSVTHIIIVELNDNTNQTKYQYVPQYQQNARSN